MNVELTPSLEDYLETIYLLCKESKVARVRDIAEARGVTAASVGTALKRLSQMELIRYERREFIELTEEGLHAALKIYSRHQVLFQFFNTILGMDAESAEEEACGLEHALSDEAMERFVRFFERLSSEPEKLMHKLSKRQPAHSEDDVESISILDIEVGRKGVVTKVEAQVAIRQRLLDMGILPNVEIIKERTAFGGDPIWIKVQGTQLALRKNEAKAVMVLPID